MDARIDGWSEIEWWTLSGLLDDGSALFTGFWRYEGVGFAEPGWMASVSVTPEDPLQPRWVHSVVSESMRAGAIQALDWALRERRDPFLETTAEFLRREPLFRPYQVAPVEIEDRSVFEVVLGPLRLRIGPDERWLFEAQGDLAVTVRRTAAGAGLSVGQGGTYSLAGREMQGAVCFADGLWLAHHRGPWALFEPDTFYFHPEWQSVALRLDDGSDLLVQLESRERFGAGVRRSADNGERFARDVRLEPLEEIESLRTSNRYRYGFRLTSETLAVDATITPRHPHHEVPIFSPHRGVLELPCRVQGTVDGRAVSGAAHAEVFGAGVDPNRFFWGKEKTNLAHALERFLPRRHEPKWLARVLADSESDPWPEAPAIQASDVEEALLTPVWSMMDRGGKGWRSAWLMLCCHALEACPDVPSDGTLDEKVREFLPIIELLHTGSLIIDDIEDASPLRRGLPTLHHLIGTELAINVGNFLYFLPQLIVEEARWLNDRQRAEIYQHINVALRRGHVGQALDLLWSRRPLDAAIWRVEDTQRELVTQYRLKSGCQLEAIARIAGSLTAAPPHLVRPLARFSSDFGVAFQIADDVMDTRGTMETLGKASGEDLANGKLNFVILHALAASSPETRKELLAAMGSGHDERGLALLRRAVEETGAIERSLDVAHALMNGSFDALDLVPSEHTLVMRAVSRWILSERRRP